MTLHDYYERFEMCIYTLLGGLDMAAEFFSLHPQLVESMRCWADYHHDKGGAAWKGAAIWFKRVAMPQLKFDRELSQAVGDLDPRD